MILQSVITCPYCGATKLETMPTDACQFSYVCTGCGEPLRPKQGDTRVRLALPLDNIEFVELQSRHSGLRL
jgi:DNA-directed RNA polymerase subunit RPC12/RpoP